MTQVAILSGIYSDGAADFRTSYPINMTAVPKDTGLSAGYMRTADGVKIFTVGVGIDRGGINWNGFLYRVSGTKLIRVESTGSFVELGTIEGTDQCSFAYSFDRLAIAADKKLYYLKDGAVSQVTDPDLGVVLDVIWIDGYFMTTDGENLVVTELNDPTAVDPLKYGSSEIAPDPIVGLIKPLDEVYAMNRYTVEIFDNIGGTGFPFQRVSGATINCGLVTTQAKAILSGTIVFVGSRENQPLSVYIINGNAAQPISTREIDIWLAAMSESEQAKLKVETRKVDMHEFVYVHGSTGTAVYDFTASQQTGVPIWTWLSTSKDDSTTSEYRAYNFVYAYGKWHCGDKVDQRLGYFDKSVCTQYGEQVAWALNTTFLYNETNGAIIHEMELVYLGGRSPFLQDGNVVWACWTDDGLVWSDKKSCLMGNRGDTANRLTWYRNGAFRNYRGFKFSAVNKTPISIARLDMKIEGLYV